MGEGGLTTFSDDADTVKMGGWGVQNPNNDAIIEKGLIRSH
jgi:hypothetical protein